MSVLLIIVQSSIRTISNYPTSAEVSNLLHFLKKNPKMIGENGIQKKSFDNCKTDIVRN